MSELNKPRTDDETQPTHHFATVARFSMARDSLVPGLMGGYELLAGIVLAWFWWSSALAHITNSYYFLSSIYSYEILAPMVGLAAAMGLPALQLVLAAALITRRFAGGALLVSAALLTVLAMAQISALLRGLEIGCGCFGASERQLIGGESLATTSVLLICALTGFICWYVCQRLRFVGSGVVDVAG